jgi:monofunctional biosynthetic peptidoglycan transglycosylase
LSELLTSVRLGSWAAARFLILSAAVFVAGIAAILLVLRVVDPPLSAVMLRDKLRGARVESQWMPLDRISPHLVRAVISSEDAHFCSHWGVDLRELSRALRTAQENGLNRVRGASTLTMQVAKNLFLWTDRSIPRKALELAITPLIEVLWPKRRILEVHLNIAQWGHGLFGAEMAARRYFDKPAADLDAREASLLAVALPAPGHRSPGSASRRVEAIATRLRARMSSPASDFGCVL